MLFEAFSANSSEDLALKLGYGELKVYVILVLYTALHF